MYIMNQNGELSPLTAKHEISLSPGNNAVRFKLDCPGYSYAYVVGDFNNYQQNPQSRLAWQNDPNDGYLKLTIEIIFSHELSSGSHYYSFIVVDNDGYQFKIHPTAQETELFSFQWQRPPAELQILAAENYLLTQQPVSLIAVFKQVDDSKEVLSDLEWRVEPPHPNIQLSAQSLVVTAPLDEIANVRICCYHPKSGLIATKIFPYKQQERSGTLIHFIRHTNDYSAENFCWDLWTFSDDGHSAAVDFSAKSDFGMTASVFQQNIIVRRRAWGDGWSNDWSEQTTTYQLSKNQSEYFIIYADPNLYSNLADVIAKTNPRIEFALMDDHHRIKAQLSHAPMIGTQFHLYLNGQLQANANALVKQNTRQLIFNNISEKLHPSDLVEIRATNTYAPHQVQMRNILDGYYYPDEDMGVVFTAQQVALRLWAPSAIKVEIAIYNSSNPDPDNPEQLFKLASDAASGTHYGKLARHQLEHKLYLYRLSFNELDRHNQASIRVTHAVDPYAPALSLNGLFGVLLDLNHPELKPDNWDADMRPQLVAKEDAIIYELHLRDFTINQQSGIQAPLRGKYLGAVAGGSSYQPSSGEAAVTTGIDSLVELGVTHVHLLPFFDFSSVDELRPADPDNRNWGYDPQNYNAPEGSYSLNPAAPAARIKETRAMISGFHQRGLRVIMDVVYNHMSSTNNFDNIVPGYYFRQDGNGKYSNGSGCGNELATEHPMVSKFILNSVLHWINDYKIDGLRIDLMELMDFNTMQQIVKKSQAIDPSLLIYGEPWKGGDTPLKNVTYRGSQKNANFSIFNDIFRDAIRGDNTPTKGFVNGEQHNPLISSQLLEGLKGSINGLTAQPCESINYVDAHDNYTLWDHLEKSHNPALALNGYRKNLPAEITESPLVRQYMLALGIILTAQGIPFLQGGVEMLRTKQGDHNSYKGTDQVNALYWPDKVRYLAVFHYLRGLIELRKQHPAFKMQSRQQVLENLQIQYGYNNPGSGIIITQLTNHANGDSWKNIVIIYNATAIDGYDVNKLVPAAENAKWHIVANHKTAGTEIIATVAENALPALRSHSLMIIYS